MGEASARNDCNSPWIEGADASPLRFAGERLIHGLAEQSLKYYNLANDEMKLEEPQ
jgi:hypothetical protein